VTETVYIPVEQRRRTREQEEFDEAIAALVSHLIDRGIARAKPVAEQWWRETVRPAIDSRRAKISERRTRRQAQKNGAIVAGEVVEPAQEVVAAPQQENRPNMSSAEAQARYCRDAANFDLPTTSLASRVMSRE
jgi:ribosomal protein L13E